jgi:hypothetical protein
MDDWDSYYDRKAQSETDPLLKVMNETYERLQVLVQGFEVAMRTAAASTYEDSLQPGSTLHHDAFWAERKARQTRVALIWLEPFRQELAALLRPVDV